MELLKLHVNVGKKKENILKEKLFFQVFTGLAHVAFLGQGCSDFKEVVLSANCLTVSEGVRIEER